MVPFKPVIEPDLEGAFLTEDPINIIKSGKAADVPILTGLTSEDGGLASIRMYICVMNSCHLILIFFIFN